MQNQQFQHINHGCHYLSQGKTNKPAHQNNHEMHHTTIEYVKSKNTPFFSNRAYDIAVQKISVWLAAENNISRLALPMPYSSSAL